MNLEKRHRWCFETPSLMNRDCPSGATLAREHPQPGGGTGGGGGGPPGEPASFGVPASAGGGGFDGPLEVGVGVAVGVGAGAPELEAGGAPPLAELAGVGDEPVDALEGGAPDGPDGAAPLAEEAASSHGGGASEPGALPGRVPDALEPVPVDAAFGTFHVQPLTERQRLFEERELHETG